MNRKIIAGAVFALPLGMSSLLDKSVSAAEITYQAGVQAPIVVAQQYDDRRINDQRYNGQRDQNRQNIRRNQVRRQQIRQTWERWNDQRPDKLRRGNIRWDRDQGRRDNRKVWVPGHYEPGFLGIGRKWVEGHWADGR